MKLIDKYVAKNFLVGYVIALLVLVGLRIVIDLFVNLDEFAERSDLGSWGVLANVLRYYGAQSALYFRDFAGIITVVAAVFSLGKMTRNNELVAIMASGVSLKRVIAPIVALATILTGLLVIDQEYIIPPIANELVRAHDALPGEETYDVWFVSDSKGSLICTDKYDERTGTMYKPMIITREQTETGKWLVLGKIQAKMAVYNSETEQWDLTGGEFLKMPQDIEGENPDLSPQIVHHYKSSLTPFDIPIKRQETYKSLLSLSQLSALARQGARVKDVAELYSQKHFRVTEPIINLVMLMVALPILVCREPKAMKTAIMISFGTTLSCFVVTFICKMIATEAVFGFDVRPELWAWVPVFVFFPIAVFELDSMKT